jgi:hypothetical protein
MSELGLLGLWDFGINTFLSPTTIAAVDLLTNGNKMRNWDYWDFGINTFLSPTTIAVVDLLTNGNKIRNWDYGMLGLIRFSNCN